MKTQLKIDKLTLSTPLKLSDINYPYKNLPGYKPFKHVDTKKLIEEAKDYIISKYEKVIKYKSTEAGSSLIICNIKKKQFRNISPIYMIFYTDYDHKISHPAVTEIERFFQQLNIPLRISIIHLAMDLISEIKSKPGLYEKVIMALKPGAKRKPNHNEKLQYETSKYFGETTSGNHLVVYDKGEELKRKGIKVKEDICRIELRMRMNQMNNFIRTTDELANYDWSMVYPKYYSFHHRTKELKQKIKAIGKDWRLPIWELRDIMEKEYDVHPSNFYRDYLVDHPHLSVSIPRALSRYRWGKDST
jgi:hypothetical protein